MYEFIIEGRLPRDWPIWFPDFDLEEIDSHPPTSRLRGVVGDQSALHGVLAAMRDLGLTISSVRRLSESDGPANTPPGT